MSKAKPATIGAILIALGIAMACYRTPGRITKDKPVVEGVLYRVFYQLEGGRTGGLTRENNSKLIPGGSGSWNVDAYGRLYPNYLVITYSNSEEPGPLVIPVHRLIEVQFGGEKRIAKVASHPAP
jgi:hypothetical protein